VEGMMFLNFLNPKKRAASHEFEAALYYLLHDAEALVPLLKETYKKKWSRFIDDILKGANPYEEATGLICIFLRSSFERLDRYDRDRIITSIAEKNVVSPPNLLRVVGQIGYTIYLAELEKKVREQLLMVWVSDMAKTLADAGRVSVDQCKKYLVSLTNFYRVVKLGELRTAKKR
jgi:hypothetical protein